jgi:hypothetical protein
VLIGEHRLTKERVLRFRARNPTIAGAEPQDFYCALGHLAWSPFRIGVVLCVASHSPLGHVDVAMDVEWARLRLRPANFWEMLAEFFSKVSMHGDWFVSSMKKLGQGAAPITKEEWVGAKVCDDK